MTATGGSKGAMAPKRLTHFCFAKETDFRINWPTPRVVEMQKKRSAFKGSALPLNPAGALRQDPSYWLALRAHHVVLLPQTLAVNQPVITMQYHSVLDKQYIGRSCSIFPHHRSFSESMWSADEWL